MGPVKRRPTILDVAKLCGVTPATVSRVLNAKSDFSTRQEVRDRILQTAHKVGYVPDLAARNLNRGKTRIIGIFASPLTHFGEGVNESLLEGLAAALHRADYDVFIELSPMMARHAVPRWRFDGAILMQAPRPETVAELDRRRVPYVCVNETVGEPVGTVLADDAMGMRLAVRHLAELGHRTIGYANSQLGYFSHYSVSERLDTLMDEARRQALRVTPESDQPFPTPAEFLQRTVIRDGATGVICYDHLLAVMLLGAARELNLRVPDDFSLICFNDVFPVAHLPPPLTAVSVSGFDMGRFGAKMLLDRLTESSSGDPIEQRVPEELVIRASTSAPPACKAQG